MLLTLVTLALMTVLIVSVVLRLKRPTVQKQIHHEPVLDSDEALGLRPITRSSITPLTETAGPVAYVMLHVMAPAKSPYGGYELLQTLLAQGLRYGDKKIFHRYEEKEKNEKKDILFSIASANKPGTFELATMGNFTCPGLTLFMILKHDKDLMSDFDLLLETARQLVEDLGGEIWDETRQVLTQDAIAQLRTRLRDYSRRDSLHSVL